MTQAAAATEIGNLISHILALAPGAGLYVSIKVEPRDNASHNLTHRHDAAGSLGGGVHFNHASGDM